jgi:hypothetical protein
MRKAPWFIHCLIVPNGCSTIARRRSRISGLAAIRSSIKRILVLKAGDSAVSVRASRAQWAVAPLAGGCRHRAQLQRVRPDDWEAWAMLRTRHEWIGKLAAVSSVIPEMHLEAELKNTDLDTDAFNLANCDAHCRLIARAIDELVTHGFSSKESARDLLGNLIARHTYGAFAEIAAYDWLTRCCVGIKTQVAMAPGDVLAARGSTLDGKIVYDDDGTYFDVKAFGANGRLAQRLKERLEKEIPSEQVLVEESWDLSFERFQDLIASVLVSQLISGKNGWCNKAASAFVLRLKSQ